MGESVTDEGGGKEHFPQIRWSLVLSLGGGDEAEAGQALAELCGIYWYPLYCYSRGWGLSAEDAEDATQDFFRRLLEKGHLETVERGKGRLRSYLLTGMKRFLVDAWRKGQAERRGGGEVPVSIDWAMAEKKYALEPADPRSPDVLFDKSWAYAMLESVLARLEKYYAESGRSEVFAAIREFLSWNDSDRSYGAVAQQLGMAEPAVRQAVFKMRRRFRAYLEQQVADTVTTPEEAKEEVDYLCAVLAS